MEKKLIDKKAFSQIVRTVADCCYTQNCKPDRFYRCLQGNTPRRLPHLAGAGECA